MGTWVHPQVLGAKPATDREMKLAGTKYKISRIANRKICAEPLGLCRRAGVHVQADLEQGATEKSDEMVKINAINNQKIEEGVWKKNITFINLIYEKWRQQ